MNEKYFAELLDYCKTVAVVKHEGNGIKLFNLHVIVRATVVS